MQPSHRIARRTPAGVYRRDRIAEGVIRIGGGAVLLTVLGICVYLAAVVMPLFQGGTVDAVERIAAPIESQAHAIQLDEYNQGVLVIGADGTLTALHAQTGAELGRASLTPDGAAPSALSAWARDGRLAVGLADGSVRTGRVRFRSSLRPVAPAELDIPVGASRPGQAAEDGPFRPLIERVDEGRVRVTLPAIELSDPVAIEAGEGAVIAVDVFDDGRLQTVVALRERGPAAYSTVRTITPVVGPARTTLTTYAFDLERRESPPKWVFVSGDAAHVYLVWPDGLCQRYAAADPRNTPIELAETVRLSPSNLTAAGKLIGSLTILAGDEAGALSAWFPAPDPTAETPDRLRLVRAHTIMGPGAPVTSIGSSWRDRSTIVTDALGKALIAHVASEKRIVQLPPTSDSPAVAAAIAPKNDGLAVLHADGTLAHALYEPGYPEITLTSLFAPMHYEGQPAPMFSYQSSAGDDAAEPKLSLTPLIFGTLKATVVAMLFACPLAVLAAIYTSEFLSPGVRRSIKPSIELMASLPSVVLGFVAAMVVAPLVRDLLPGIMTAMVTVPLAIVFGAGLWTLVPISVRSRFGKRTQFGLVTLSLAVGIALAWFSGPMLERALFKPTGSDLLVMAGSVEPAPPEEIPAWVGVRDFMSPDEERILRQQGLYFRFGEVVQPVAPPEGAWDDMLAELRAQGLNVASIRRWLNGEIGGPWPGWLVAMIPVGAIVSLIATNRGATWLRRTGPAEDSTGRETLIAIGQPVAMLLMMCLIAAGLATALTALGLDPRDSIFGRFTPRNSLVVGVIMGFAIIPIIYSISEDALASVPNSLRAASLGAGASQWQTAVRVVLPVAASGIFSASMIGLGRAVGETMIVLMATGNTPTMDLNIFEGFRTLSANIAVELPEAPKGEGLYRVLFLCGLVLFLMTFVINTTAEIVRQHYRKKNALL